MADMNNNRQECTGNCSDCTSAGQCSDSDPAAFRRSQIKKKILVLSGKGGVGKSTVAVNLAQAIERSMPGASVGLLDVDVHGPSVPGMMGLTPDDVRYDPDRKVIIPAAVGALKVMSVGLLVQDADAPVIWRGPLKYNAIKQFIDETDWGTLDYLIVDAPPGTGDEPLSVTQILGQVDGAVIVTTPQNVSVSDVRRCVRFCQKLEVPVLGVIENMSGFVCPKCGEVVNIFKKGGGKAMAEDMHIPFLASIPIEPAIVDACDAGTPVLSAALNTEASRAFIDAVNGIISSC